MARASLVWRVCPSLRFAARKPRCDPERFAAVDATPDVAGRGSWIAVPASAAPAAAGMLRPGGTATVAPCGSDRRRGYPPAAPSVSDAGGVRRCRVPEPVFRRRDAGVGSGQNAQSMIAAPESKIVEATTCSSVPNLPATQFHANRSNADGSSTKTARATTSGNQAQISPTFRHQAACGRLRFRPLAAARREPAFLRPDDAGIAACYPASAAAESRVRSRRTTDIRCRRQGAARPTP